MTFDLDDLRGRSLTSLGEVYRSRSYVTVQVHRRKMICLAENERVTGKTSFSNVEKNQN